MTTWTVDAFGRDSSREARRLAWARGRWDEQLAGRTVWCVASLPDGRDAVVMTIALLVVVRRRRVQ